MEKGAEIISQILKAISLNVNLHWWLILSGCQSVRFSEKDHLNIYRQFNFGNLVPVEKKYVGIRVF